MQDKTDSGGKPKGMDVVFYDKLRKSIEIVKVDSASDELLSSSMMRGRDGVNADGAGEWTALTPNMKLVARDALHASRRSAQCLSSGVYAMLDGLACYAHVRMCCLNEVRQHLSHLLTYLRSER